MAGKKGSRYSINKYTFTNPNFMTEAEIKWMYKTLRMHMQLKYGRWDDEVIHRTIIRGLYKWNLYNPKKASKLVWFQSILRFIYLQEVATEYQSYSQKQLSLDYIAEGCDEDLKNIIPDIEDEYEQDMQELAEFCQSQLAENKYALIAAMNEGKTRQDLQAELGIKTFTLNERIDAQRIELKKAIEFQKPHLLYLLTDRKRTVVFKNGTVCINCNSKYTNETHPDCTQRFCSSQCKKERQRAQAKSYIMNKKV